VGVFFQLIIGKIDVRHEGPLPAKPEPKIFATKAPRPKEDIYYAFFVPGCLRGRIGKVLSKKAQNSILMNS
jgi:hypothetical protein